MYQAVLIAALATSSATPSNCFRCSGYSCYSCYSCYSGYSGYSGYGGYGYGCSCPPVVAGYGAAGGCYGYHGGCYGGWGVFAGDPFVYSTGCYGCYGGYACYGLPVPPLPGFGAPVAPPKDMFPPINPDVKKKPQGEETPPPMEKMKTSTGQPEANPSAAQARARISIEVPEGGKLYVDGRHINVGAGTREFQSPPLAPEQTYFYDIRIEVGNRSDERRVLIRSGQDVAVSFPRLNPAGTRTVQVVR